MTDSSPPLGAGSVFGRFAFRFAFAYFILYSAPEPLPELPGAASLFEWYDDLWHGLVTWFAHSAFGATITVFPAGSGDTTYNYVQIVVLVALALFVAAAWTALDLRRDDARLADRLRIYLRYVLGVAMVVYGSIKIVKTQFPFPPGDWLMETYGESSPMRLAWTFMGYSTAYNVFMGLVEFTGGFLLFFRRTTTLGSLVLVGALANVVMINFCYDVPVKLYSAHLLVMACWLLAPDARRLADLLVLHRPTTPVPLQVPFTWRWAERVRPWAKTLFVGGVVYAAFSAAIEGAATWHGDSGAKSPLHGIYVVEAFEQHARTDARPWTRLCVSRGDWVTIRSAGADAEYFQCRVDETAHTLTLSPAADKQAAGRVFRYARDEPRQLVLEGEVGGAATRVRFRRIDESELLLVNRGFRWVNEVPFNR
jgi:hypothetical protein